MGPTTSLDDLEKRKIPCSCRESNDNSTITVRGLITILTELPQPTNGEYYVCRMFLHFYWFGTVQIVHTGAFSSVINTNNLDCIFQTSHPK